MTVKPFRAVRPSPELAASLNVPPYDVVDTDEVRKAVANNPHSFFHVTRAEVDIPGLEDEHSQAVYDKARENFLAFLDKGWLRQDGTPCYYLLAQTWRGRTQHGVYAAVSCQEYLDNKIKKHELTRKDKEEDRTNHIMTTRAGTGPVFLAFPGDAEYRRVTAAIYETVPTYHFTDENSVENRVWVVSNPADVAAIESYFGTVPALYIADGHHRAASAVNVYKRMKDTGCMPEGAERFMAVCFPAEELAILPYNRVVLDLNGLSEEDFMKKISARFSMASASAASPVKKGEIIMYINKKLYQLKPLPGSFNAGDPQASLDVSILQNNLLAPVLGIDDPRTSKRIRFVGGVKGPEELMRQVDSGAATVSFCLYPVSLGELMAITDNNQIMPPKSTWFEPKLRDGLIVYTF